MSIKKKSIRILIHVSFWIVVFTGFMFLYGYRNETYIDKLFLQIRFAFFEILYVYFVIYFLIPRYLLKKKTILFFGFFSVTFILTLLLEQLTMTYFSKAFSTSTYLKSLLNPSFYWLALENLFIIILASSIKFTKQWFQNQRITEELKRKNLETELQLLKSQLNPHFLFNTLNNINSLIFIDQQKTYDTVIKLSDLMRYMIYETNTELVFLNDEIEAVKNYIELQRIRLKNHNYIDFSVKGNPNSIRVAPMLFIPFVENAFKHGKKESSENTGIQIHFEITKTKLFFSTQNQIKQKQNTEKGGIGIENAKRRLQLLYANSHQFSIKNHNNLFTVQLTIEL
jgi:two-component system LytT family sensor kinase